MRTWGPEDIGRDISIAQQVPVGDYYREGTAVWRRVEYELTGIFWKSVAFAEWQVLTAAARQLNEEEQEYLRQSLGLDGEVEL